MIVKLNPVFTLPPELFYFFINIGFATLILQYRVTLFAIPLVPVMEKLVVEPGKKFFGEKFGEKTTEA